MSNKKHQKNVNANSNDNSENTPDQEAVAVDFNGDSELVTLRDELEQANEQKLRVLAELENYRARMNRQMLEERKYASIDLMRDLLPIWDNMNRALEAAEKSKDIDSLTEGVKMISEQFIDVLARHDCVEIEALHQPFDPNVHASIAQQPSDEYPANTVIYVSQAGFKLHDRVVRPSQVILSSVPPTEPNDSK